MKIWRVAAFIFLFSLVGSFFNHLGIFEAQTTFSGEGAMSKEDIYSGYSRAADLTKQAEASGGLNWVVMNLKLAWEGITILFGTLADAIIVYPMLASVACAGGTCSGGLHEFLMIISVSIILLYIVGLAQIASGRNLKRME